MHFRWLPGLLALLVLALAGNLSPTLALPAALDVAHAEAAAPCHGDANAERPAAADRESPACCPDGCPGHCMVAAALIPAPPPMAVGAAETGGLVWSPLSLASRPPGAADRPPRA